MSDADFTRKIKTFKKTLEMLANNELNEADTVFHFGNFLCETLGYDRLTDISREFAIRSTYCDYALKIKEKLALLIEIKAMPIQLKDSHLRQTIDYAMNAGVDWCLLTNLKEFQLYHVEFTKPIDMKNVFTVNVLTDDFKNVAEKLFYLSKNSLKKKEIDAYWAKISALSEQNLANALLSADSIRTIKRTIKKNTGANLQDIQIANAIRGLFSDSLEIKIKTKKISKAKNTQLTNNKNNSRQSESQTDTIVNKIEETVVHEDDNSNFQ
jgi:hypothetical protein